MDRPQNENSFGSLNDLSIAFLLLNYTKNSQQDIGKCPLQMEFYVTMSGNARLHIDLIIEKAQWKGHTYTSREEKI